MNRVALVVIALLVLSAAAQMPVIQDEAYYWTWAQSLAPRYFDRHA